MNQGTAQTAEPIFTGNTSKEPVFAKVLLKGLQNFPFFHPKNGQTPFPCISMGNRNANSFLTVKLIFTKFSI